MLGQVALMPDVLAVERARTGADTDGVGVSVRAGQGGSDTPQPPADTEPATPNRSSHKLPMVAPTTPRPDRGWPSRSAWGASRPRPPQPSPRYRSCQHAGPDPARRLACSAAWRSTVRSRAGAS